MKTPEDPEERSRRDSLVEPLFGGLDATRDGGRGVKPRGGSLSASAWLWILLSLVSLAAWFLL